MVSEPTISVDTARISGFIARHPKLVAGLLAMVLFLAVQEGAMAADAVTAEPASDGITYLGPDPDKD